MDIESFSLSGLASGFGAGLLTSLTPCVYPLIPITLAVLGTREAESRWSAFRAAFMYVMGIALTYTVLGIAAAKTGAVFGSVLSNAWVQLAVAVFLTALIFYALELFSIPQLASIQTAASRIGGKGLFGSLLMGAVSGIVAAPCVGPVLALILGVAASSGNVWWGAALLFTYAFGLGMPFLVLGTFSNLLGKLPRSGNWMSAVKFFISTALFVFLLKNLSTVFPALRTPPPFLRDLPVLVIIAIGSAVAGLLSYRAYRPILRVCSLVVLGFSLWHLPVFAAPIAGESLPWRASIDDAIAEARNDPAKGIIFVDFSAEWCAACHEFKTITFPDPEVRKELDKLVLAQIDFTSVTEATTDIASRYEVAGLPCLIFLDESGKEIPGSRITGFLRPDEFVQHLRGIRSPAT